MWCCVCDGCVGCGCGVWCDCGCICWLVFDLVVWYVFCDVDVCVWVIVLFFCVYDVGCDGW